MHALSIWIKNQTLDDAFQHASHMRLFLDHHIWYNTVWLQTIIAGCPYFKWCVYCAAAQHFFAWKSEWQYQTQNQSFLHTWMSSFPMMNVVSLVNSVVTGVLKIMKLLMTGFEKTVLSYFLKSLKHKNLKWNLNSFKD